MNQFEIGRPVDFPLKKADEIAGDISRMVCTTDNPCKDLELLIEVCYKLWDMNRIQQQHRVETIVAEVRTL